MTQETTAVEAFEAFRQLLKADEPASADLKAAIAQAKQLATQLNADLMLLLGMRRTLLLADEPAREEHRAALALAENHSADAALFIEELERHLEAATEREDEENRQRLYEAAAAQRDAAVERLTREYPEIGERFRELVACVLEADKAVDEANALLPSDAAPLRKTESLVRDLPAQPREVISRRPLTLWVNPRSGQPLRPEDQGRVRPTHGQYGVLPDGPNTKTIGGAPTVERRSFFEVEFYPAHDAMTGPRVTDFRFPALIAEEPDFVTAVDRWGNINKALAARAQTSTPAPSRKTATALEPA